MKKTIFFILLISYNIGISQTIYEYEREIRHKENYNFTEIDFQNKKENIKLSGTLITPQTEFDKIVIIVPGSTKDTRYSHFILAEEFLKNGIAVYRFDERGIGKSEGQYTDSATKLSQDLSYAFKKLKQNYKDKIIGIFGHSRGGMASIEMIENGINPKFLILMGTPVVKNGAYIINGLKQDYENSISIPAKGKSKAEVIDFFEELFKIIANNPDSKKMRHKARILIRKHGFKHRFIRFLDDEDMIEMVQKNYEGTLKNINIPTLYLLGSKDEILNYKQEAGLIKSFNNPNIKVEILDGLNHYVTEKNAPVGTSLYKMDPKALNEIMSWITKK